MLRTLYSNVPITKAGAVPRVTSTGLRGITTSFTCCNNDDLKLNLGPAVYYGKATISIPISTLESSVTTTSTSKTSSVTQITSDVGQTSASTIDAASFATQSITSATQSPTDTTRDSTHSSIAIAAGLGVGIPVGLILVGLIAFLFYRLGQRQSRQVVAQQQEEHTEQTPALPVAVNSDHSDGSQNNEALLSGLEIGDRGFEAEMAYQ